MRLSFIILVLGLSACIQDEGNSAGTDTGLATAGDAGEQLVGDDYRAGMEKSSENGLFKIALISSDPIPLDLTEYTWLMEVRDAQGQPISDATLEAEPFMPEHGHGTFPRVTEGVASGEPGQFTLSDLDLFMAGTWKIELRVSAGELSDTVFYYFTLGG